MTTDITGLCQDHSFETAEEICRRCGLEFCELCLVYPFGTSKPLCKECAMAAGGVRSHVVRPAMSKREVRKKVKVFESRGLKATGPPVEADPSSNVVLRDPLVPTDEDLERAPLRAAVDDTNIADELAAAFDPPEPQPGPDGDHPANGVAPAIDWSQPFG